MRSISLITKIRRKLRDRSGQSTTEYILILAIVVMIASKMKTKLQTTVGTAVDGVGNIIQGTVNEMGNE
jgi:Flp pilus assembly pilin Flp